MRGGWSRSRCGSRGVASIGAAALLLVLLARIFRRKLKGLWEKAKQGGVILAGYGIAVTFHTIMSVMGGNSIANTVSVTPGGVGVKPAANVAANEDVTDAATATA